LKEDRDSLDEGSSANSDSISTISYDSDRSKSTHNNVFERYKGTQDSDDESKHDTTSELKEEPTPACGNKSCSGACKNCRLKETLRRLAGVEDLHADAAIREILMLDIDHETGEYSRERNAGALDKAQQATDASSSADGRKRGTMSTRKISGLTPPKKKVRQSTLKTGARDDSSVPR
jgi:hypothetical protein